MVWCGVVWCGVVWCAFGRMGRTEQQQRNIQYIQIQRVGEREREKEGEWRYIVKTAGATR